jgi:hypothetical protein
MQNNLDCPLNLTNDLFMFNIGAEIRLSPTSFVVNICIIQYHLLIQ